jgi:DNA-binding transcriptional LysR family regulator
MRRGGGCPSGATNGRGTASSVLPTARRNERLAHWSDFVTRQGSVVMRCSSQGDMLAAVRAGLGISALSCLVGSAYPDLVRVAPQKLASVSDLWLLAHPDLVDLPAVRAMIDFVADCARADRARLRG